MLAAVAAAIASTETNIDHVSIDEQDSDAAVLIFELRVRDRRAPGAPGARHPPHARRERVTRTIAAHARSAAGAEHDGDPDPDPRG